VYITVENLLSTGNKCLRKLRILKQGKSVHWEGRDIPNPKAQTIAVLPRCVHSCKQIDVDIKLIRTWILKYHLKC
jgi:hypothetical protein